VVLARFSNDTFTGDKKAMAKSLLRCKKKSSKTLSLQKMLVLSESTTLADLIGPDSWTLFDILNVSSSFLKTDPSYCNDNPSYKHAHGLMQSLNVVNDVAERALGLLTSFNTGKVTQNAQHNKYC